MDFEIESSDSFLLLAASNNPHSDRNRINNTDPQQIRFCQLNPSNLPRQIDLIRPIPIMMELIKQIIIISQRSIPKLNNPLP